MALKKSFEKPSGVSGDHWAVEEIHMHIPSGKMDVSLALYLNKASKDGDKKNLNIYKSVQMDLPPSMGGIITAIETHVKTNPMRDQEVGDAPYFNDAVNE